MVAADGVVADSDATIANQRVCDSACC